jgi:hypothetical protein
MKNLEAIAQENRNAEGNLALLSTRVGELEAERNSLQRAGSASAGHLQQASMSLDQIRQRSKRLLDEIKKLEAAPSNKKQLKYHAPLSRAVRSDEMFFECKDGRVTYIDLPTFMRDVKASMDEIGQELKAARRVERITPPVGAYRLRYAVDREATPLDVGNDAPERGFRYGLSEWTVEPLANTRGETLAQALAEKSEFRQLTDQLDNRLTIVTFWVYPDSFELFRRLRDHLYERGLDIAGRPLPPDAPIAASRYGTASRGQ